MSAAKFLGVQVPVSGGGYFRILPYWLTRAGLKQIERRGRPFTFYLHPWEVDPGQPRIRVGAFSRLRHYKIGRDTSELQSPCNLVCRLLLEKKKKKKIKR